MRSKDAPLCAVQTPRTVSTYSRIRSTGRSYVMPKNRSFQSFGPVPRPSTKRPAETSLRLALIRAASTGWNAHVATPVPSRMRFVRAAIAVSGTKGSRWIWTCQMLSKPASSARTPDVDDLVERQAVAAQKKADARRADSARHLKDPSLAAHTCVLVGLMGWPAGYALAAHPPRKRARSTQE